MNHWLVNPSWQNFSSMYREAMAGEESLSEAERRHHQTAALYFGIAAVEAFLNQRMRAHLAASKTEEEVLNELRYTKLMEKVRKWPLKLLGKTLTIDASRIATLSDFNDLRASLTHPKTRGDDVYSALELVRPTQIVDTVAEYFVRYHEAEGTKYPYWIFGWNYLNPGSNSHEIEVLNDQQFIISLRALGIRTPDSYGWEEDWKSSNMTNYDGYVRIRDHLRSQVTCEPRYSHFPRQPKLCARWWTPDHQGTCGALVRA